MAKSNNPARGMAAAGLLAAFTQLAMAQPAHAEEQAPQQQEQEQTQPADSSETKGDGSLLDDLVRLFDNRLFDSQNH